MYIYIYVHMTRRMPSQICTMQSTNTHMNGSEDKSFPRCKYDQCGLPHSPEARARTQLKVVLECIASSGGLGDGERRHRSSLFL